MPGASVAKLHIDCWLLWIVGTSIIIASWADLVTPEVGWVGFGIALTGSLLDVSARRRAAAAAPANAEPKADERAADA